MYIRKIQKINRLNIYQKFESDCCLVENLWLVLVGIHVPLCLPTGGKKSKNDWGFNRLPTIY